MLDATTNKAIVNNNNVTGTSSSAVLMSGDSFLWYVAAESTNGATGVFSSQSFSLAAATPACRRQKGPSGTLAASNGFDMPTFSWSSLGGANHYYLYVLDTTTNQAVVNNASVSATSFTPSAAQALTPGHNFTWYIASVSSGGASSGFSSESFALAALTAPTQIGPVNTTIAASSGYDRPTFRWTTVAGTNRYWLYVQDASSYNAVVINNNNVSGNSFTPSTSQALTPGHSYIWYIAAVSTNGAVSNFSTANTFSLASVQISPSNNSTIAHTTGYLSPTFTWVAAAEAVSYDLYLVDVTNSNQQPILFYNNVGNGTSFPLPLTLTAGHRYQWYVGIVTSSGGIFWDGPETFTLAP